MLPRRTPAPRRIEIGTRKQAYPATAQDYYMRIYFEAIGLTSQALKLIRVWSLFWSRPSKRRITPQSYNFLKMCTVKVLLKDGDFLCFDKIILKIKECKCF